MIGCELLGGHAEDHRRQAAPEPENDAQNVDQEPESAHHDFLSATTVGRGRRPAKPASISCQCPIRSSPSFQHQKMSRPSSLPQKSTRPIWGSLRTQPTRLSSSWYSAIF